MSQPPSLQQLLAKYGLATVLALWFFYWITSDVSGSIRATQDALTGHVAETAYYLRLVCLNTSQNETQRAACIAPRDR